MADGVGLPQFTEINGLHCLTAQNRSIEFQGFFGAMANRRRSDSQTPNTTKQKTPGPVMEPGGYSVGRSLAGVPRPINNDEMQLDHTKRYAIRQAVVDAMSCPRPGRTPKKKPSYTRRELCPIDRSFLVSSRAAREGTSDRPTGIAVTEE